MDNSRYAVVGAGLAGSATAWRLARQGHEVTLLERTTPANDAGSSHGSARIFRYAYQDPFYAALVARARSDWDELERLTGTQLITPTGSVDYGIPRKPAELGSVLAQVGVEHELLGPAEAAARWPGIAFDTEVLWHPGAGVIDARSSVEAMVSLAENEGARVLSGWPVASIERRGGGYRLLADDGRSLDAEHVVISAGGWLPDLLAGLPLPAGFLKGIPPLQVRQEQAFHFPYRDAPEAGEAAGAGGGGMGSGWPTFIHKTAEIEVYGLPGGRDADYRGQKVAEYNGGKILPSAAAQDGIVDPENRRRVIDYVTRYLPGLVPEPYAETTCLFTNTPSEDFVLDRAENLTVVSPCSGHGAKFAPLIGRLAADLATGGEVPQRFRPASSGYRPA